MAAFDLTPPIVKTVAGDEIITLWNFSINDFAFNFELDVRGTIVLIAVTPMSTDTTNINLNALSFDFYHGFVPRQMMVTESTCARFGSDSAYSNASRCVGKYLLTT